MIKYTEIKIWEKKRGREAIYLRSEEGQTRRSGFGFDLDSPTGVVSGGWSERTWKQGVFILNFFASLGKVGANAFFGNGEYDPDCVFI